MFAYSIILKNIISLACDFSVEPFGVINITEYHLFEVIMKTKIKVPYSKTAKTYDEQIALLRKRNVIITDVLKAKEYLSDIGYYRLGFYSYPFEITYPKLDNTRSHDVKKDTTIEDIVALYYFDFDLRAILNRYLSRIEVSFRTTMTYELSVKYNGNPYWFVDPTVVTGSFFLSLTKKFILT